MIIEKPIADINTFAVDVIKGLTSDPKTLPSKYFYDDKGDALFQKIMDLEEYYLTKCEYNIFQRYKNQIRSIFNDNRGFDLIELGAGDGYKTKVLLKHFANKKTKFNYLPIDISSNVLNEYVDSLRQTFPTLKVKGICAEYLDGLRHIQNISTRKKVLMFLGANIGNFSTSEGVSFLSQISTSISKGDLIMIGFDLKKDPKVILAAYNDRSGVTRAFNFNLLKRINRELGANFNPRNFDHFPTYSPDTGDTKSFLISKTAQTVFIKELNLAIEFKAWESIQTEISKKYSIENIASMAERSGFKIVKNYFDDRNYFVDSVLEKV